MPFEFFVPFEKTEQREDGGLFVQGFAASSNVDQDNDLISKTALKKMADQIVGLPLIEGHAKPPFKITDELGTITSAELRDNDTKLFIEAKLDEDNANAVTIFKKLIKGKVKNPGFSVGGDMKASRFKNGARKVVEDVILNHLAFSNGRQANPEATLTAVFQKELETLEPENSEMTTEEIQKLVADSIAAAQAKFSEELEAAKAEAAKLKMEADNAKAEAEKAIGAAKSETQQLVDGFKVALADFAKNVTQHKSNPVPTAPKPEEISQDVLNAAADKLLG